LQLLFGVGHGVGPSWSGLSYLAGAARRLRGPLFLEFVTLTADPGMDRV